MQLTTKVINGTGRILILKEATAGVKRTLKELPDNAQYKISVDANATYREYWCAEKPDDPNAVVLSSDDCQEFKQVTILRENPDANVKTSETYYWEGLKRDTGEKFVVKGGVQIPDTDKTVKDKVGAKICNTGNTKKGWVKRVTGAVTGFLFPGESSNEKDAKDDDKTGSSRV